MGKLIKNHLARLVALAAATYQVWASLHAFFWPKLLFDWLTVSLNGLVKPVPILQILNLLFGLIVLIIEAPLPWISGTSIHASIYFRLLLYPASALLAVLLYQGTDPAGYYVIAIALYFWAFSEGEVVCKTPFTLPKKSAKSWCLESVMKESRS